MILFDNGELRVICSKLLDSLKQVLTIVRVKPPFVYKISQDETVEGKDILLLTVPEVMVIVK